MTPPRLPWHQHFLLWNARYRARHARLGRVLFDSPPFVVAMGLVLVLLTTQAPVPAAAFELFAVATLVIGIASWFLEVRGFRALTRADLAALPVEMAHRDLKMPSRVAYSERVARMPIEQVGSATSRRILAEKAARQGWVRILDLWEALGPTCNRIPPQWRPWVPATTFVPTPEEWALALPQEWPRSHAIALNEQLEKRLPFAPSASCAPRRL